MLRWLFGEYCILLLFVVLLAYEIGTYCVIMERHEWGESHMRVHLFSGFWNEVGHSEIDSWSVIIQGIVRETSENEGTFLPFLCVKGMKEYRYKPRSSRLWSGSRGRKHWNKETKNSTWKLSDVRWSRTSHSFIKVVEYFISYIWKQFNIQFASFL